MPRIKTTSATTKTMTLGLFILIAIATLLMSSALITLTRLNGAIDHLFQRAHVPDFVQMTRESIKPESLTAFTAATDLIQNVQVNTLLNVSNDAIFLQDTTKSLAGSILENSFVKQNAEFDFLLDTHNAVATMQAGEIGVPVYYQREFGFQQGDQITLKFAGFQQNYIIKTFIRDAQMNPALVTSKRILMNDQDWDTLANHIENREYLLEFKLKDGANVASFITQYSDSDLPQTGTALTQSLYKTLNALTDGITIALIALMSLVLIAVASLALRLAILTHLEEAIPDIAILKAIGISYRDLLKMHLKPLVIPTFWACGAGLLFSYFIAGLFTQSIEAYMGRPTQSVFSALIPLLGAGSVFAYVYLVCRRLLSRIQAVSAYHALNQGFVPSGKTRKLQSNLSLKKNFSPFPNVSLGIQAARKNRAHAILLIGIGALSFLMMSLPTQLRSVMQRPDFITTMGSGKSDLRIDLDSSTSPTKLSSIYQSLSTDQRLDHVALHQTASVRIKGQDGIYTSMNVENSRNHAAFPLTYRQGRAPQSPSEIALSLINAQEMQKSVGDTLLIHDNFQDTTLRVVGVYQDITNGGKTAKGMLTVENPIHTTLYIDLKNKHDLAPIKASLEQTLEVKINDTRDYIQQTLGGVIAQTTLVQRLAWMVSTFSLVLITSLYFRMIVAQEKANTTLMHHLGVSKRQLQIQLRARALTIAILSIITGLLLTQALAQPTIALVLSGVSIPINVLQSPAIPLISILFVVITLFSVIRIKP